MHLARTPVARRDAPAGNAAWPSKVLVCVCSPIAWAFFLLCARVLDQKSWEGVLLVYVVSFVAIRTPHKQAWRGLMVVFWVALFCTVTYAEASLLIYRTRVFKMLFPPGGKFVGFFKAARVLNSEIPKATWSACPKA